MSRPYTLLLSFTETQQSLVKKTCSHTDINTCDAINNVKHSCSFKYHNNNNTGINTDDDNSNVNESCDILIAVAMIMVMTL